MQIDDSTCHSCICRLLLTGFTLKDQTVIEDYFMSVKDSVE